ncbi:MAG: cation transporter [Rhodospirillales bacterium]|nr:cation transporter [Rhodospirillales bacterium]
MACGCDDSACGGSKDAPDPRWRRALWIALAVNAGFFLVELTAGVAAGSAALQADALDFFGDAANYGVSLGVAGRTLAWRSRAAALKGATMVAFALWVLGNAAWHAWAGSLPRPEVMGLVGLGALAANAGVAAMLYRDRGGEANRRSVWLCARNDAIGNLAVLLAAAGVFGTGAGWPDAIVAAVMGGLGLQAGVSILRQARGERRAEAARRAALSAG